MNFASPPLVSVVTPMYNEEQHITECIESTLAQTYPNWEHIIVDNCSTDGSTEIVRRYAQKDSRISLVRNSHFIHAIPNYNAALQRISPKSKYCKVVFADDWIFPNCLEQMVRLAEAHPSIGIVGAYGMEGNRVVWTGLPYPSAMVSGREICRRLFLDGLYVFGTATSVLYRADLVRSHRPFYNAADVHSDVESCIILLKECDFGFIHQILTFTRVRESSRINMSRDINTLAASKLRHLAKHGSYYLDSRELASCLDQSLAEYYRYLAGSVVRGRDKHFWEYHKQAFREAGLHLNKSRLAGAVLAGFCSALLNPKNAVTRLGKSTSHQHHQQVLYEELQTSASSDDA
jgi:glycosyltransferase involved in cell wall biosynthesis